MLEGEGFVLALKSALNAKILVSAVAACNSADVLFSNPISELLKIRLGSSEETSKA
jgi:hypothetical protein